MINILIITNLYPPYHIGGYELGCFDIVERLKSKGYNIKVLTSSYRYDGNGVKSDIIRTLRVCFGWEVQTGESINSSSCSEHNEKELKKVLREFSPQLVYVWNYYGLQPSLLYHLQHQKIPVVYYVSDYWLTKKIYQRRDIAGSLIEKLWYRLLSSFKVARVKQIDLQYSQFCSHYVKQRTVTAGHQCEKSLVIPWGVDTEAFPFKEKPGKHLRLLYVGQIVPHKGIITAIEAVKRMKQHDGFECILLKIVGGSATPGYTLALRDMVIRYGLEKGVCFEGQIRREQLRAIYAENDILFFPSIWEEPFSITIIEAMASGLAVVATNTGGTPEILQDGVNSMIFPKEDVDCCAKKTMELINNDALYEKIVHKARKCIETRYSMNSMIDRIDRHLQEVLLTNNG